jgi:hypothetical protein
MRWVQWLGAILFTTILLGLTPACSPAKPETITPPTVTQWTVEGTIVTEPFTITEVPWEVRWEFIPSTLNFFQIDIWYSDGRFYSKPIATTTTYNLALTDSFRSYDKGTFYLEITAEGGVAKIWVISQ